MEESHRRRSLSSDLTLQTFSGNLKVLSIANGAVNIMQNQTSSIGSKSSIGKSIDFSTGFPRTEKNSEAAQRRP